MPGSPPTKRSKKKSPQRRKNRNENDRKPFLSLFPIALISVLAVGASAQQRDKNKGAPRNRPNIIFFINDDQNKEGIGCYGGKVLTPHLDRLAREGMRMDNAHVIATVCTPSRYSMFTGRYPGNSYFKPYLEEFPKNRHGAPGFNVGLEEDNMNVGIRTPPSECISFLILFRHGVVVA